MTSFWKKLIIGNLICIKTCYSFKLAKPFQWQKTQVPRSWRFEITLIDASGHVDQKLPNSREYFWAIFFLWTKMIREISNQKPTLSKQILTWEEMLQLGRPSMACIVALSRQIVKKMKKKKNKRKINCHVMHLKNSSWV